MVATTLATRWPSPVDSRTSAGDLVLRICNSPREGQLVRLKSPKCTIGAGPRCTLRLRAQGVSPVHCLIVRGPKAAIVRRWAADTRLNHQSFDDAVLSSGDHLSIGSIDLQVVSVGAAPTSAASLPATDSEKEDEQQEHLAAQRTALEAQQSILAEGLRRWESQKEKTSAELAAQTERQDARLAELDAREKALAEERRQWESQRNETSSQLAAESEKRNTLAAETQAEREAFQQQQQQWQAERDETRRQWDEQHKQLAAQLAELETQKNAQANQLAELETQKNAQANQLAELETQKNALAEERRQWEKQQAESISTQSVAEVEQSPEPSSEKPSEGSPVDLAEVFRRLGAKVDFEEGQSAPESPPTQPERTLESARQPAANVPASAKEGNEEESIDDYMRRLMQRVGAGEPAAPSFTPPPSSREALLQTEPNYPLPSAQRMEPASTGPRSVAPEKRIDLTALRELANLSADFAISRHSRQTLIDAMYSKLVVAIVAILSSGTLLWMWHDWGATPTTYYAAMVGILVAFYWGIQYAFLTGRLTISKSGHIDMNARSRAKSQPSSEATVEPDDAKEEAPQEPSAGDGSNS